MQHKSDVEHRAEKEYKNLICQIKCNALGHPGEVCLKKLPEEFSSQDTFAVYH